MILKLLKTQLEADKEILKAKEREVEYLKEKIGEHITAIKLLEKGGLQ